MADSGITISLVQASVSFFAWAPLWAALFIAASGLFHPPIEAAETKDPKQHWAFKSPVRPQVPEVKNKKWVRTPIDNFVLARLDKEGLDRKSTRLNSSHTVISYAVFCLKKK